MIINSFQELHSLYTVWFTWKLFYNTVLINIPLYKRTKEPRFPGYNYLVHNTTNLINTLGKLLESKTTFVKLKGLKLYRDIEKYNMSVYRLLWLSLFEMQKVFTIAFEVSPVT